MIGKKFVGIGCLFSVLLLSFDASAQEATTVQGPKSKVQSLDGGRDKTWKTVTELSA